MMNSLWDIWTQDTYPDGERKIRPILRKRYCLRNRKCSSYIYSSQFLTTRWMLANKQQWNTSPTRSSKIWLPVATNFPLIIQEFAFGILIVSSGYDLLGSEENIPWLSSTTGMTVMSWREARATAWPLHPFLSSTQNSFKKFRIPVFNTKFLKSKMKINSHFSVFPRGPINKPTKLISGWSSCGIITLSLTRMMGGLKAFDSYSKIQKDKTHKSSCPHQQSRQTYL